jgi:ubiquinone/menaquinone biosynthesis C-methylase UbiE
MSRDMTVDSPERTRRTTADERLGETHKMARADNAKVRRVFDKVAPKYDRSMQRCERLFLGRGRAWATARASGDVLELAVGTGLNLPEYLPSTQVLGIDLSEQMVAVARTRIAECGLGDRTSVEPGDVQALDLPSESFDTAVSTYTFCTIPDPAAAAREAFRTLRAGGRFLLVEHGPSTNRFACAVQRALDPLFVRLQADHLTRDPVPYVEAAGFRVDQVHRDRLGVVFRVLATKPST